jgi:hypothetical protein
MSFEESIMDRAESGTATVEIVVTVDGKVPTGRMATGASDIKEEVMKSVQEVRSISTSYDSVVDSTDIMGDVGTSIAWTAGELVERTMRREASAAGFEVVGSGIRVSDE